MRSKTGGIYSSSQDEGFSECRDTYRDFREELYTDSKENPNWKEGKPGKKMSLTKTPFPNLDRCSCGTPGGKNNSEILVKSETLKRKTDFLSGTDGRPKVQSANKSNNDYTSTSTGPGTRNRPHDGVEETRMRASTSTGQIPLTVDDQAVNERNPQRPSGHSNSAEIRRRRMTYSDDDDNDDETDDEDEDDEDVEEDEDGEDDDQFHPSTSSKVFGNTSRTGGAAKSASNCSDYTSLAFDLNYVKVSPPKLRRRRKKALDTVTDAPLMVRRERSAPKPLPAEHPPRSDRKVSNASVEGVDAGPSTSGRSKDDGGVGAAPRSSPPEHRQPAPGPDTVKQSPGHSTVAVDGSSKDQAGYISWAEARHLLPQNAAAAKETTKFEPPASEEPATRTTNCGITTSGSLLQFTFTVRLDNDVIRGARRGSDQSAVGPSLVSGRVDILSPGILMSTSENVEIRNRAQPSSVIHITTQKQPTGTSDTVTRNCHTDVPLNAEHDKTTSSHVKNTDTESTEVEAERPRDDAKGVYGTKAQNPDSTTRSVEDGTVVKAAPMGGTPVTNNRVLGSSCKQPASGVQTNHGTTVTTTAIVHKSASEDEVEEETDGTEKMETKDSDAGQMNNSTPIRRDEERGFDEVDFVPKKRQFHEKLSKTPVTSDSENERTHMNWDEVLEEAQSLGIPLTRPAAHCRDCSRDRSTASPSKRTDNYWVCSSCTEALQGQGQGQGQQQQRSSRKTASKTSSPFKDKFKLQTIFGCKRTKDEKTGGRSHQDVMSYPPAQTHCSPSPSSKYRTMPAATTAIIAHSSPDIHKCIWSVSRSGKQTGRGRSMSPGLTVRCGTAGSPSPRASSGQCRGDTRGQQRISHLCSPPQHRCRFSYGRTAKVTSRTSSESASNHISTGKFNS